MCTSVFHLEHTPADEPDSDSTTEAIESNLAEYWLTLGTNPNGNVHVSDDISWGYSGGPFFNRVVNARLTSENVDRYINGIVRTFHKRRAAVTWLVSPSTTPADIGDRLQRCGFYRQEVWRGMVHDLASLPTPLNLLSDLHIEPVASDQSRHAWSDVVTRSFQFPGNVRALLADSFARRSQSRSARWFHNLAYLEGRPVAASTLFVSGGTAGIYLVSTVQEARGMGLGTLMTLEALRQAQELGCRLAVLQSTEDAHALYEKLGFRHHCNIDVYRLPAPIPVWKQLARAGLRVLRRSVLRLSRCSRLTNPAHSPDTHVSQPPQSSTAQTRS